MPSPSKEQNLLELFYNYPSKHWHFKDLKKSASLSDSKLIKWLHKFTNKELIKRIKKKGEMPYYIGNYESPDYQNMKRIFALETMYKSGLLNHLLTLKKARTVVVFGSFSRGDWNKESDIDIFIYGDDDNFELGKYETKLHREIQTFVCKNKKQLKKFGPRLIRNILRGDLIKGDLRFLEVN